MSKNILISGASGLVGQALVPLLVQNNYTPLVLVRRQAKESHEIEWDPFAREIDLSKIADIEAVINLSGENIARARWNPDFKKRLYESRLATTDFLVEAIYHLKKKPKIFLNASATGFYGNRGDEVLMDNARPGKDFLSGLCIAWENAAMKAAPIGVRTCLMRLGILLSAKGGALKKMLPPFRMGLGGPLGDGQQYMSWMDLSDVVAAILFLLENETLNGPINFVSPEAVTNQSFSKELAGILKKPCLLKAPAMMLKLLLGEMAEALLLSSSRVQPQKLLDAGFKFQYPALKDSLSHCLQK